jgi:hypothetical protein
MSRKTPKPEPKIWTYKGVNVHPASLNASGIRWWALTEDGQLRACSKEGMRQLINDLPRAAADNE